MNLGLGKINGFGVHSSSVLGLSEVFSKPTSKQVAQANKINPETISFYKPLKVECEFCKEKIGLLNDDVFTKSQKVSK